MDNRYRRFEYNGFSYRINKSLPTKTYYKCSKCDTMNCKAKLIITNDIYTMKGTHTCSQTFLQSDIPTTTLIDPNIFVNEFIKEKSIHLEYYPHQIYTQLLSELRTQYQGVPYTIPSKKTVYATIREERGTYLNNTIHTVKQPPLRLLPDGQPFFRRHWEGDIHGEYHQIMIWATNECLSLMRYNGPTFIDCTFRSVPSPFVQCLIVMIYDAGTEIYIPCAYCLMTGKSEYLYRTIFHELIVLLEYSWMPQIITTDFEYALIGAIKHQFPNSHLHGCYFHMKQSLRRKLQKYRVNEMNMRSILVNIELLTFVRLDEITIGINFIKTKLVEDDNLDNFWRYFERTWMRRFLPELWNLSNKSQLNIRGRTNNALERYNRRIGDFFLNAHPNLCAFVSTIRSEFQYFSDRCKEIRQNASGINFNENNGIPVFNMQEYELWKRS